MRPQVLVIVVAAMGLMAVLLWSSHRSAARPGPADGGALPPAAAVPMGPAGHVAGPAVAVPPAATPPAPAMPDQPATDTGVPTAQVEAEQAEVARLLEARGPESLPGLAAKLDSQSPEVRVSAVEALKQLGDANAIPILQQKAEAIQDPYEKIKFLDAAKFLALPKWP